MPPAYSFGTSQRGHARKSNEDGPGPGEYIAHKYHNRRPPTWKIGLQERGKLEQSLNPGPGAYDNSFVTVHIPFPPSQKRQFPLYQFGIKIPHDDVGKGITPGPGAYDQKPILKSASQYSFGLRHHKGNFDNNGPGPAAYETNYSTLMRPSSRIGTQQRGDLYESSLRYVPGVGNYNVRPGTAGPFYGFGSGTRDPNFISKQTPGPGTYEAQSTIRSMGKTMSVKHAAHEREDVPGPGTYESYVEQVKRGNPKYRIGTARRRELNENELNVPGPGAYVALPNDKRRPPSYKIGSETRGHITDQQVPGPGAYEIKRDVALGKKYPFGVKPESRVTEETPGPQDYYPEVVQTHIRPASCKVGSERRDKVQMKENPGPDQYNVAKDLGGPRYPFGSEQRVTNRVENFPGPGQYEIPPYFANNPEYLIPNHSSQFTHSK